MTRDSCGSMNRTVMTTVTLIRYGRPSSSAPPAARRHPGLRVLRHPQAQQHHVQPAAPARVVDELREHEGRRPVAVGDDRERADDDHDAHDVPPHADAVRQTDDGGWNRQLERARLEQLETSGKGPYDRSRTGPSCVSRRQSLPTDVSRCASSAACRRGGRRSRCRCPYPCRCRGGRHGGRAGARGRRSGSPGGRRPDGHG